MTQYRFNSTDDEDVILERIAKKTGRTVEIIIANYLHGFIGSLRQDAMKEIIAEEFEKLSLTDQKRAVNYVKGIV